MALDHRHVDFCVVDINDLLPLEQIPYFTQEASQSFTASSTQPSTAMSSTACEAEAQPVTQQQQRRHHQHLPNTPSTTQNSTNGQPSFTPIHPALSSYLQPHSQLQDPSIFINVHKDPAYTIHNHDNKPPSSPPLAPVASDGTVPQQRTLFGNLTLHIHNILKGGLPFPNNSFDIVYQSQANFSYTPSDWKYILSELLRVTKPGGYIQLIENDLYFNLLGPVTAPWQDRCKSGKILLLLAVLILTILLIYLRQL